MAVQLKEWKSASASQVKTFSRCQRKWFFEKRVGLPTPTSPAAALGTKIHAELEEYLLHGTALTSDIARCGRYLLPTKDDNILVEHEILLQDDALPVPLKGIIDLVELDERRITDHKTTGAFRWIKTEYELLNDPQGIIYTMYAHRNWFAGDDDIRFRHVYYRTKGHAMAREVEATFSIDALQDGFGQLAEVDQAMSKVAEETNPQEVEPNVKACYDYGGCPFREYCAGAGLPKDVNFRQLLGRPLAGEDVMNFREKMAALKAKQKNMAIPKEEPTTQRGVINPPDGTPMDQPIMSPDDPLANVATEPLEMKHLVPGTVDKKRGRPRSGPSLPDGGNPRTLSKKQIPPVWRSTYEKMSSVQRAGWATASNISSTMLDWIGDSTIKLPKLAELRDDLVLLLDIAQNVPTPVTISDKEEKVQQTLAEDAINAHRTEPEEPSPIPPSLQETPVAKTPHLTLYIGCLPTNPSDVVYLSDFLRPYQEQVAKDAGLPYYALVEYGQGGKRVAGALSADVFAGNVQLPQELVCAHTSPCTDAVLEVLRPMYDCCVVALARG